MSPLRLAFTGFWSDLKQNDNFITNSLDCKYELSSDPQVVFFSCFDMRHRAFPNSLRVFFSGENVRPNRVECDHAISFELDERGGRDIRWPLYNLYSDPRFEPIVEPREKFCSMVVSNAASRQRIDFFQALSKYRSVDSGGRTLNNVGGPVKDKMEFLRGYRFSIAFENAYYPGYTTEKILEAKKAGCIPIYWGNPEIALDFNTDGFVNAHAFRSFSQCIEYIEYLDRDEGAFRKVQEQPLLRGNGYTKYSDRDRFRDWLNAVVASRSRKLRPYFLSRPVQKLNVAYTRLIDLLGRSHFIYDRKARKESREKKQK